MNKRFPVKRKDMIPKAASCEVLAVNGKPSYRARKKIVQLVNPSCRGIKVLPVILTFPVTSL
jgi:hypothetical protein